MYDNCTNAIGKCQKIVANSSKNIFLSGLLVMLTCLFAHFNILLNEIVIILFQRSGKNEHFVYDVVNLILS